MIDQTNQTKERPIIFSDDMVQAILCGKKTQTRRVIDPQPTKEDKWMVWTDGKVIITDQCVQHRPFDDSFKDLINDCPQICKYGKVGDRLWVRESHRPISWDFEDNTMRIEYKDGEKQWRECFPEELYPYDYLKLSERYFQKICDELEAKNCPMLSGSGENWQYDEVFDGDAVHKLMAWRSPMFMPRWTSRLLLEIIEVRVERLQDISEADAKAEGVNYKLWADCEHKDPARLQFIMDWNKLNAKRGYDWASNPWVWAIEFKVIEGV